MSSDNRSNRFVSSGIELMSDDFVSMQVNPSLTRRERPGGVKSWPEILEESSETIAGQLKRLLDKTVPKLSVLGEPLAVGGQTVRDFLKWLWGNIWQIALRADSDHIFLIAAGIAFNIAIAFVPTILILLFVLGYVLDPNQVAQQLNTYLDRFIVSSGSQTEIIEFVRNQVDAIVANRGIAGILGFLGLAWTSTALASSIRVGINGVMRCREEKFFLVYKLYDFLTIVAIGILVFVAVLIGPLTQVVTKINHRIVDAIPIINLSWIFSELFNLFISVVLFFIIFRFTPYQKQRYSIIFIGTFISALLWTIARLIFGFYVAEFNTFSRIYGIYAIAAASAFWIYYTALVFLIGAEVAYHIKQSTWNARRTFHRIARNLPSGFEAWKVRRREKARKEKKELPERKS